MKDFFQRQWNQPGIQLATWFSLLVAVVWSASWTYQDKSLNLLPVVYALGFYVFLWLMSYLFRNNP